MAFFKLEKKTQEEIGVKVISTIAKITDTVCSGLGEYCSISDFDDVDGVVEGIENLDISLKLPLAVAAGSQVYATTLIQDWLSEGMTLDGPTTKVLVDDAEMRYNSVAEVGLKVETVPFGLDEVSDSVVLWYLAILLSQSNFLSALISLPVVSTLPDSWTDGMRHLVASNIVKCSLNAKTRPMLEVVPSIVHPDYMRPNELNSLARAFIAKTGVKVPVWFGITSRPTFALLWNLSTDMLLKKDVTFCKSR